jgi:hypothetical protein
VKKNCYLCIVLNNKSINQVYFNSILEFFKKTRYKKIFFLNLDEKKFFYKNKKKNITFKKILDISDIHRVDYLISFEFKIRYFFDLIKIKKKSNKIFYFFNNYIFFYRNYTFKKKNIKLIIKLIYKKINFCLFWLLQHLKLIPVIDLIFHTSNIKITNNKFFYQGSFPIDILDYKKAIRINSLIFEYFIKNKNNKQNKNIVFLDGCFNHKDRFVFCHPASAEEEKKYYFLLNSFFEKLKIILKKEIHFLAHPDSNINSLKKYMKNIKIIKNNTSFEILVASHVFFQESSSVNLAILLKKKFFQLKSPLLGKWVNYRTKIISQKINCPTHSLERLCKMDNNKLFILLNKKNYIDKNYIQNNLALSYNGNNKLNLKKYKLENLKIFEKNIFDE